jgi:hypothetical protein
VEPTLTWAALLGRWTDFARSALALPKDADGERWRRSVASIIGLQAVTFALAETPGLPPDEAALGLDRAEILVGRYTDELASIWLGWALPAPLAELIADARAALDAARRVRAAGDEGGGAAAY